MFTKEYCLKLAKSFSKRNDFYKAYPQEFEYAFCEHWLDEICGHMTSNRNPRGFYSEENLKKYASKFKTLKEFIEKSPKIYSICNYKNISDEIFSQLERQVLKRGTWTKEKCREAALSCRTRSEFLERFPTAYGKVIKRGWSDDFFQHMEVIRRPKGYWTLERCQEEALLYQTRTEFQRGSGGAYDFAARRGWLDKICGHMVTAYNGYYHCIYVVFNDRLNKAYIGITRQKFDNRIRDHKSSNNSTNSRFISQELDTVFEQLTDYIYRTELIGAEERKWIQSYIDSDYEVLNDEKSIGCIGVLKEIWTDKKIFDEAKKYDCRQDFHKFANGAYGAARRKGILDQACEHMEVIVRPRNSLTKEKCKELALRFNTRTDFSRNETGAYKVCSENNWLDEFCSHMKVGRYLNDQLNFSDGLTWTKEKVLKELAKYKTLAEFRRGSSGAYNAGRINKWLHGTEYKEKGKRASNSTFESCKKSARRFKTRSDFERVDYKSYNYACKKKFIDEICGHMVRAVTPHPLLRMENNYRWTEELCILAAKRCSTKKEFVKYTPGAESFARRKKILEKVYGFIGDDCNLEKEI